MKNEKKGFTLKTRKQLNWGAAASGLGFLLFLLVSALDLGVLKDIVVVVCALISLWVFVSASDVRKDDKEAVSYNLLWGTGSLAIMLGACAILGIKLRLGL